MSLLMACVFKGIEHADICIICITVFGRMVHHLGSAT